MIVLFIGVTVAAAYLVKITWREAAGWTVALVGLMVAASNLGADDFIALFLIFFLSVALAIRAGIGDLRFR